MQTFVRRRAALGTEIISLAELNLEELSQSHCVLGKTSLHKLLWLSRNIYKDYRGHFISFFMTMMFVVISWPSPLRLLWSKNI